MKLTTQKLKKLILEEFKSMKEQTAQAGAPVPPEEEAAPTPGTPGAPEAAGGKPDDKEQIVKSTTELKKQLITLSQKITGIPGLDQSEIKLIDGLIGVTVKLAADGSESAILQRVYDVLSKKAGA